MEVTWTVTFGNILVLLVIIIGLVTNLILVASKLSEFKGIMTTRVDFLSTQVSRALNICDTCGLPKRIEKIEGVQSDRTVQIAKIEAWMESVDRRLENIEKQIDARKR